MDYRGEVSLYFDASEDVKAQHYNVGDRIGQMEIVPVLQVELTEVETLEETKRGSGSYGSTGIK